MLGERLREFRLMEGVPIEARQQLNDVTRRTAIRNLLAIRQLDELARRLNSSFTVILLKGAALARTVYSDVALRPMVDLDLLAKPEDLTGISDHLRSLGYRQHHPAGTWPTELHHGPPFTKNGYITIELHRRLFDEPSSFPVDHESLFMRAEKPPLLRGFASLPLEDHLIYVCLHAGFAHRFSIGLYALLDVVMIARSSHLDWTRVLERAREWKAGRCVYLMLRMVEVMLGADVPSQVMASLEPHDFSDAVIKDAADAVRFSRPPHQPVPDTVAVIARFGSVKGLKSIPRTIKWRFLVHPERRNTWVDSDRSDWYSQLAPLLSGAMALIRNSDDRRYLKATLAGARVSRWIAQN